MSSREDVSKFKFVQQQNPSSVTATVTPADAAGVDTAGYDSATFVVNVGSVVDLAASPLGDGSWTFRVQEAASDVNASYANITDATRIRLGVGCDATLNTSTGTFLTLDSAAHQNSVFAVGVISDKQFLRLIATAVTTPGASLLSWSCVLGRGATPVI